jgi:hypothetical protein
MRLVPLDATKLAAVEDRLGKGNLSVSDPGPVTPPTAQVSTTFPKSPSGNSSGAWAEGDGKQ